MVTVQGLAHERRDLERAREAVLKWETGLNGRLKILGLCVGEVGYSVPGATQQLCWNMDKGGQRD